MILFKSCPRCSGDRSVEEDLYGTYVICLHCGHVSYPDVLTQAERVSTQAGRMRDQWPGARQASAIM